MTQSVTLSVIVPAYNTLPYLSACLQSLEKQTLAGMEVVLVDDGSTDGSGRVLREQTQKDPRFRYIGQANGGLSVARNTGLRAARGRYVAFLDSDDWIAAPDSFERNYLKPLRITKLCHNLQADAARRAKLLRIRRLIPVISDNGDCRKFPFSF